MEEINSSLSLSKKYFINIDGANKRRMLFDNTFTNISKMNSKELEIDNTCNSFEGMNISNLMPFDYKNTYTTSEKKQNYLINAFTFK